MSGTRVVHRTRQEVTRKRASSWRLVPRSGEIAAAGAVDQDVHRSESLELTPPDDDVSSSATSVVRAGGAEPDPPELSLAAAWGGALPAVRRGPRWPGCGPGAARGQPDAGAGALHTAVFP